MIDGSHRSIGAAIVYLPSGEARLQLVNPTEGTWLQLKLPRWLSSYVRKHLKLEVIACEPAYTGTEEPVHGGA